MLEQAGNLFSWSFQKGMQLFQIFASQDPPPPPYLQSRQI